MLSVVKFHTPSAPSLSRCSLGPAEKHFFLQCCLKGGGVSAALESRSDCFVIHHVTLTAGAQRSEVKTSPRWYNAGAAWVQIIFILIAAGDGFWNSTHSAAGVSLWIYLTWHHSGFNNTSTYTHLYADTLRAALNHCNGKVPQSTGRGKGGDCDPCGVWQNNRESRKTEEEWDLTVGLNPGWPSCVYPGCPIAPPFLPTMPDLLPLNLPTISQVKAFVDKENISWTERQMLK